MSAPDFDRLGRRVEGFLSVRDAQLSRVEYAREYAGEKLAAQALSGIIARGETDPASTQTDATTSEAFVSEASNVANIPEQRGLNTPARAVSPEELEALRAAYIRG